MDFAEVHGFPWISRVGGLPAVRVQTVAPKETFARSQVAAMDFIYSQEIYGFPWFSKVGVLPTVTGRAICGP